MSEPKLQFASDKTIPRVHCIVLLESLPRFVLQLLEFCRECCAFDQIASAQLLEGSQAGLHSERRDDVQNLLA